MSENGRSRRNGGFDGDSTQIQAHQKKQDEEAQLEKIWEELENSEEGIEIDPDKFLRDMAILDDLNPLPDFDLRASWQDFKEKHRDLLVGLDSADQQSSDFASEEERPKRKRSMKPIRISLVVVMILAMFTMASCGIIEFIIKAIGDWSEDVFNFQVTQELNLENDTPERSGTEYYSSLEEALEEYHISTQYANIQLPDGYVFQNVRVADLYDSIKISVSYIRENEEILFTIWHYYDSTSLELNAAEKLPTDAEIYICNGVKYYIIDNTYMTSVTWVQGTEMYFLTGNISSMQVKQMIDSIFKG